MSTFTHHSRRGFVTYPGLNDRPTEGARDRLSKQSVSWCGKKCRSHARQRDDTQHALRLLMHGFVDACLRGPGGTDVRASVARPSSWLRLYRPALRARDRPRKGELSWFVARSN